MTSANTIGRAINIDGVQLYADTRSGTAPSLVFLHYWGGSRRTWQPVLTRLHPDQAFVNYDQRGWGDSANAPGPYDMKRLADDAQSVIATLGYTDYVLVGHSMGGKVAQALAARRPAGLAGVVLVAPAPAAPVGSTEELQQLRMHAYDDKQTVQQSIDRMLTYQTLTAELRKQVVEDSLRAGDEARLAWPKHGLVQDVSAGLATVDVPVLVLAGSHDSRTTRRARRPPAAAPAPRHHDRARGHRSSVAPGGARSGGQSHHHIHRAAASKHVVSQR
jgi:pimeloyl-ACP methyl ester carboxylesterase